jgi:hypothetical protein
MLRQIHADWPESCAKRTRSLPAHSSSAMVSKATVVAGRGKSLVRAGKAMRVTCPEALHGQLNCTPSHRRLGVLQVVVEHRPGVPIRAPSRRSRGTGERVRSIHPRLEYFHLQRAIPRYAWRHAGRKERKQTCLVPVRIHGRPSITFLTDTEKQEAVQNCLFHSKSVRDGLTPQLL